MRHLSGSTPNQFGKLNLRRVHTLFGSENQQNVVFQDGQLYTMNGRRLPQDFADDPARMESYAIPGPLKFLLTGGPMPPEAAAYFPEKPAVVVPGLEKYSHDQIRQAVALLEQMNTASTQHPVGVNLPAPEAMPKPDPLNMLDAMPAPSAPLGDLLGGPAKSVKVKVGKT